MTVCALVIVGGEGADGGAGMKDLPPPSPPHALSAVAPAPATIKPYQSAHRFGCHCPAPDIGLPDA